MGVREEIIRLSLQDAGVSSGFAKDAASAMALAKALDYLDGRGVKLGKTMPTAARSIDDVGSSARRNDSTINQLTGRLRLMADAALILGPALEPIGGVAIAGLGGLAGLLGGATVGALGLVAASNGIVDAFKALEKAKLDPTVENIAEAERLMSQLAPEAQTFIAKLGEALPALKELRNVGAAGWFEGLNEAIDQLGELESVATRFMHKVGDAGGAAVSDSAESLASDRWRPFLEFLTDEAPQAITALTGILGDLAHAGSEIWMAFDPSNDKFVDWLGDVADGLDDWASSEKGQDQIRSFLAYAEETGPKVADFIEAGADAFKELVEAGAPLGGPTLEILTSLLKVVANLADSDLATPIWGAVAAYAALNRAAMVTQKLTGSAGLMGGGIFSVAGAKKARTDLRGMKTDISTIGTTWMTAGARSQRETDRMNKALGRTRTRLSGIARGGAPAAATLGLLAASSTDAENSFIGTNAELGIMIGLMSGNPLAAAAGAIVGNFLDIQAAYKSTNELIASGDQDAALDAYKDRLDTLGSAWSVLNGQAERLAAQDIWSKLTTGETQTHKLAETAGSGQSAGGGTMDEVLARRKKTLQRLGVTEEEAASGADGFSNALARNARQAERTSAKLKHHQQVLKQERDATISAAQGFVDFGHKAKAASFTLDGWLSKLEAQIAAMREFRQNAQEAANKGLRQGLIKYLRQMGPEGALQLKRLADASGTQIKRANKDWDSFQREGRLAGKVVEDTTQKTENLGNTHAKPTVQLDGWDAAIQHAHQTQIAIDRLHGKTVDIVVRTVRTGNDTAGGPAPLGPDGGADGMTVPGPRHPYGDKILAYLAPGEEVISNRHGEADQFRADRSAGRIPHYADGTPRGTQHPLNDPVAREARDTARALKGLKAELKEATSALEKEKRQRDALIEKMHQVESDVSGGLRSDLFGETDAWASASTSPTAILQGDLANAKAMAAAIRELRQKGLSGPALAEVLSQGGLAGAQALADWSRKDLREFSQAFGARNRVLTSVGDLAGTASFGAAARQEREEYRDLKREVVRLRHAVEKNGKNNREDHKQDRNAQRRGTGDAGRNRRRNP